MQLKILVGTMTGIAKYVAQAIQMDCADLASDIEVEPMDGLDISVFDAAKAKDALYIICSSTYGSGDVPGNASIGTLPESEGTEWSRRWLTDVLATADGSTAMA